MHLSMHSLHERTLSDSLASVGLDVTTLIKLVPYGPPKSLFLFAPVWGTEAFWMPVLRLSLRDIEISSIQDLPWQEANQCTGASLVGE